MESKWMSMRVARTWRQPLDCGGLTPLFFRMVESRAEQHRTTPHVLRVKSQSGVKPPHSKASRHSHTVRNGTIVRLLDSLLITRETLIFP